MLPAQFTDTDSGWSYKDPAKATPTSTPTGSSDKRSSSQATAVAAEVAMSNNLSERLLTAMRIASVDENGSPQREKDKYVERFSKIYDSLLEVDLANYRKAIGKDSDTSGACKNSKNTVSQSASSDNDDGASVKVFYPSPSHLVVTDDSESITSASSTDINALLKSNWDSIGEHDVPNVSEPMSFQEFRRRASHILFAGEKRFEFELDEHGHPICGGSGDGVGGCCGEHLICIVDDVRNNHLQSYVEVGPNGTQKELWYCKKCDFIWPFDLQKI